MTSGMDNASIQKLRSVVDRVERLEEEIAGLNADKADIYAEAKGFGLDVKPLKALIAKRRKMARDPNAFTEGETVLEMYEAALDGTFAPSRARAREEHDPETGEITTELGQLRTQEEQPSPSEPRSLTGGSPDSFRSPACANPAAGQDNQGQSGMTAPTPYRIEPRVPAPAPEWPDMPPGLDRRNWAQEEAVQ